MSHVVTVTGPVDPGTLGFTLPHEHNHLEMWEQDGLGFVSQLDDDAVLEAELRAFVERGGSCLVDQTPRGAGRQPERLVALSELTGVSMVAATGWYTEPYYPPEDLIGRRTVSDLAEIMLGEIENGIGRTGVRPGLIGEIGASQGWVSPIEERVHRAAARAQIASGLPLATHTIHHGAGRHQIEIFDDEGLDPARVSIGHCDTFPNLGYSLSIAEWGGYVSFDNIGVQVEGHEERLIAVIVELIDRGHLERILLSHDMGQPSELGSHGGRGLTYLFDRFIPKLKQNGVDEAAIRTMTVENPVRWLTVVG